MQPVVEIVICSAEAELELSPVESSSEDIPLPDPVVANETTPSSAEKETKQDKKPKESIQGQLQAIKQGFVQFMQKRDEVSVK